jgi:PIN domain nuclease of toxin-antitoxin system
MTILLDSHALLWLLFRPERLETTARDWIAANAATIMVSIASIWELEIKRASGKLEVDLPNWLDLQQNAKLEILPISIDDAARAARLPPHHRDPFDRMLIAQALNRDIAIVTRDGAFAPYGVRVVAA